MDDNFSIEDKVYELKPFICKVIKGPMLLQHLQLYILAADVIDIKKAYERMHHERATTILLQKLIESSHTGKWQAFVEALKNSEYPYLVSLLKSKGENPEDYRHQITIIQIFAPYLASLVEPLSLLSQLKHAGLIDTMDEQEIFSCANSEGATAATMFMLDRIQCRQPPSKWFFHFLKILLTNGHKNIVKEMEPEFSIDCQVLKQDNNIADNSDNDMEQGDSEESLTEYIIEARLENFRQEIIELVSVQKIAANLSHYLLPIHIVMRLSQLSKESSKEAMESLLEEVGKLDNLRKWSLFVSCLKQSDYSYIAAILTRTCEKGTYYRERNLIKIFTPSLQHQLEPRELIAHLLLDKVINEIDKDEILLKYRCSGSIAASIALLDCMQCRLSPDDWYSSFLNALIKCGRNDLVNMVDPDFLHKSEYEDEFVDEVQEPMSIQSSNIRLEFAYARVLEMKRSAKQEVAKLRQKYEEIENLAMKEIQKVSDKWIETLLEANTKVQSTASNTSNYKSHIEIEQYLDRTLESFHMKEFKFVTDQDFLSVKKLGSIFQTEKRHRRRQRFSRNRSPSPCLVYRDRRRSHYRHRSSSSGSTQSSGFIHIKGINEIPTHLSRDQNTLSSEISGQNAFSKSRGSMSFSRQESISSIYTDSLSLSSSEDLLSSDGHLTTEISELSDINAHSRSESFVNFICYKTISVPHVHRDYQLSSFCILPTDKLVMIDQNHSSLISFDPYHAYLKTYKMKRFSPVRVICCENNNVFVLLRRGSCRYIIVMYKAQYSLTRSGERLLKNLVPIQKLQHACEGQMCAMSCSCGNVFTVCYNGHIHTFSDEGMEKKVTKIKTNLMWPHFCTTNKDAYAIFIYDVYSSSIGKYVISSGKCVWTVTVENNEVNDVIACFERLFISQNNGKTIIILRQDSGEIDQFILPQEILSYPLGLASNRYQNTMLLSSYNPKVKRGNNVIRYFSVLI